MKLPRQRKVTAIIPAAGSGKRFGPGTNKPFQPLGGKPLILWSLETLQAVTEILEIIPVLRSEDTVNGKNLFERHGITKIKRIAQGGKERQDSVYNGLRLIEDRHSIVLIHDGARPLVEKELIEEMISEMKKTKDTCDGIVPGIPVKDTIKQMEHGLVRKTLKRDDLWAIQTPQVFPYEKISRAYEKALEKKQYATDDAAVLERCGGRIRILTGSYRNIKITTMEDLIMAEALIKK